MSKTVVAYFSASGKTDQVAKRIADRIGCETFEIKPKQPYTNEDLNWRSKSSRSTVEMSDKSSRPEVDSPKVDLSDVDTVFVGFPMWWYIAPTIVNTFLEANDFSGKKIILFATSGGSGFGKTVQNLKNSVAADADIVEGRVFSGSFTAEDVDEFVDSIIQQ
ncbi:MAG: flavodoxin [Ruminococcus sp.]|nr:flavodoxin [Ruminococcus sp.]